MKEKMVVVLNATEEGVSGRPIFETGAMEKAQSHDEIPPGGWGDMREKEIAGSSARCLWLTGPAVVWRLEVVERKTARPLKGRDGRWQNGLHYLSGSVVGFDFLPDDGSMQSRNAHQFFEERSFEAACALWLANC